jgi:hypothetical protein
VMCSKVSTINHVVGLFSGLKPRDNQRHTYEAGITGT